MKNTFTLLTFVFAALFSNAQITIDSTDLGSMGDQLVYIADTNVTGIQISAPTGTFQTFNYTGLGVTDIGSISFLNPVGTPAGADFPNSNLVLDADAGGLVYLIKTDTAVEVDGIYGDILNQGINSPIDFNPNVFLMKFPMNYQSSFIETGVIDTIIDDTITGIYDSLRLVRSMKIISNVDAYGLLQLPALSDTVLRKYDIEITSDSVYGLFAGIWALAQSTTETKNFYRFIGKGNDYYLLEAEADASGNVLNAQYQTGGTMVAGILNYKNISCNGLTDGTAKVTVVDGVAPFTYLWDDPSSSTTQQITGLAAGTYTVTVTDFNGTSATDGVQIIDPDTITITGFVIGDNGTSNGAIDVTPTGGTPGFTYSWSNGSTNQNLNSLPNGIYTVTVTDSRGCTNSETFIVIDLTSVQDIFNSDVINVFPNPSTGMVNIQTTQGWSLKMYTLVGAQVAFEMGAGNAVLDVSNQPAGIYLLEITIDDQVYFGKLQLVK